MYHRRSQSDSKSTNILENSFSSSVSTTHPMSSTSTGHGLTTNRVSIYSMRERIILNKMTRMMGELASDTETEVTSRIHQEIPAIRLDDHLTYYFYITIQNLIQFNAIHILIYHAVFWLNPAQSQPNVSALIKNIEQTEYEQTLFVSISNDYDDIIRPPVNIYLINKYSYITLIGVSSIELIAAILWTLQKKLVILVHKYPKCRNLLGLFLLAIIFILYLAFIAWLFFHTFITHYLTMTLFVIVSIHFIVLTFLDKPYLFRYASTDLSSTSNTSRKQARPCSSSFPLSPSITVNSTNRFFYRSSSYMQSRKVNTSLSSIIFSSRWLSTIEDKLDAHKCSILYAQTREEADDLWSRVVRRLTLNCYRTFASFILFNLIPFKTIDAGTRPIDNYRFQMLTFIFILSTFLTHSVFLFPVKFQTNLHRLSTHLGQWRLQTFIQPNKINEWSSECNSYTRGSIVKLSSNNEKYFIAIQHLSNAAHPQSISHSILYRLFGDAKYFLTLQFLICLVLILCQLIWIIQGKYWHEILISILIIFKSSYTIFKIIRDRLIFDLIDDNEYDEIILTSKQKKSN